VEAKPKLGNITVHQSQQQYPQLKMPASQDDNPTHQFTIETANTCILEYQATHPTLVAKQQPTLDYGLAYLQHGNTKINKQVHHTLLQLA
jgi:hypothetical protein